MATTDDWTSFTPTWTSNEVFPRIGDGFIGGLYRFDDDGFVMKIRIKPSGQFETDDFTKFGTGTYLVALPVGPSDFLQWIVDQANKREAA